MELKISEIRRLCNLFGCKLSFFQFLSDYEVNQFHNYSSGDSSDCLVFDDGLEVTHSLVSDQQRLYDDLDLYIKFLQELAKYRPLPF